MYFFMDVHAPMPTGSFLFFLINLLLIFDAAALEVSLRPTNRAQSYSTALLIESTQTIDALTFQFRTNLSMKQDWYWCVYESLLPVTSQITVVGTNHVVPLYRFQMRFAQMVQEEHEWTITVKHAQLCEPNVLFHGKRIRRKKPFEAYLLSSKSEAMMDESKQHYQWRVRYTLTYQLHEELPPRYETLPHEFRNNRMPENHDHAASSYIGLLFHSKECLISFDRVVISRYQTNACVQPHHLSLMQLDASLPPRVVGKKALEVSLTKSPFTQEIPSSPLKPSLQSIGLRLNIPSAPIESSTVDINAIPFHATLAQEETTHLFRCEYESVASVPSHAMTSIRSYVAPVYRFQARTARIITEEHDWIITVLHQHMCEPKVLFHGKKVGAKSTKPYKAYVLSSEATKIIDDFVSPFRWRVRYTLTYHLHSDVPPQYETLPLQYLNTWLPERSIMERTSFIGLAFPFKNCLVSFDRIHIARVQKNECVPPHSLYMMALDTNALIPRPNRKQVSTNVSSQLVNKAELMLHHPTPSNAIFPTSHEFTPRPHTSNFHHSLSQDRNDLFENDFDAWERTAEQEKEHHETTLPSPSDAGDDHEDDMNQLFGSFLDTLADEVVLDHPKEDVSSFHAENNGLAKQRLHEPPLNDTSVFPNVHDDTNRMVKKHRSA